MNKSRKERVYLGGGTLGWIVVLGVAAAAFTGADEASVLDAHHKNLQRSAGARLASGCVSCHEFGNSDKIGPRLGGVLGRRVGAVPGFDYSAAMRGSNRVWNEETLVSFLMAPSKVFPGTRMAWSGMSEADAKALVRYLKERQ
jgi:cytochrome c